MLRIGVLVSGGGTNLQSIIDAVESGCLNAEIAAVVSSNPNAYALVRAERHGLNSVCLRKRDYDDIDAYCDAVAGFLEGAGVGLVLTAGWLVVLSERFIKKYGGRMMNIHPSLIPAFCGKGMYGIKVHESVLAAGVKVTGATVQFVTLEVDAGPIILQKAVEVLDGDTPETLQKRVMEEAERVIFPEAVRLFIEKRI